jgi:hypothetical protein
MVGCQGRFQISAQEQCRNTAVEADRYRALENVTSVIMCAAFDTVLLSPGDKLASVMKCSKTYIHVAHN